MADRGSSLGNTLELCQLDNGVSSSFIRIDNNIRSTCVFLDIQYNT